MNELDMLKDVITNITIYINDPYLYEVNREKLLKMMRKDSAVIKEALINKALGYEFVLEIAAALPQYISLTGERDLVDTLSIWEKENREHFNTKEIELYIEEAEKMYSSLFVEF